MVLVDLYCGIFSRCGFYVMQFCPDGPIAKQKLQKDKGRKKYKIIYLKIQKKKIKIQKNKIKTEKYKYSKN